ncbi:MAG: group II intron reverse transcriptase/maturase [Oligoflexia bacterium]|nr:group II intron reverse transcriptase/maturase [Oligoflexia bacterium]
MRQKSRRAGSHRRRVGAEPREVVGASKHEQGNGKPEPNQTYIMEKCVERDNVLRAWRRVKANGGSPGVDGMRLEEAGGWLREHWIRVRNELLNGSYQPALVRRAEIPKTGGGMRQLGIPTVLDRLIQQCILQVLQPIWDPTFHKNSYGFRPGKSAHQAICHAQQLVQDGRGYCVDVDLEKFFDRVNHDVLMDQVRKRVADKRLVDLIRRYLRAGMLDQGLSTERTEGTPQGGPLSPLLANLLLNEVDWELEKRGLSFVRYADDCNVYLGSRRAAERTMQTMGKLMGNLRLRINRDKSAVARATERKFLGYRLWIGPGRLVKRSVAPQAAAKFKQRVRELTGRSRGRSTEQTVGELGQYLRGWKSYFSLADTARIFLELDGWIRRRLRMTYLKQWKRGKTWYRELTARGLSQHAAASIASHSRGYWAMAGSSGLKIAFPNSHFDSLGLPQLGVPRLRNRPVRSRTPGGVGGRGRN